MLAIREVLIAANEVVSIAFNWLADKAAISPALSKPIFPAPLILEIISVVNPAIVAEDKFAITLSFK